MQKVNTVRVKGGENSVATPRKGLGNCWTPLITISQRDSLGENRDALGTKENMLKVNLLIFSCV